MFFIKQGNKYGTTYFFGRILLLGFWAAILVYYVITFLSLGRSKVNGFVIVNEDEAFTAMWRSVQVIIPVISAFAMFWLADELQHKNARADDDDDSFLERKYLFLCLFFTILGHGIVWLCIHFMLDPEDLAASGPGSFNRRVNTIFYVMFAMQSILTLPASFMLKRKVNLGHPSTSPDSSSIPAGEEPTKKPKNGRRKNS